jgi:Bacterial Ig domain
VGKRLLSRLCFLYHHLEPENPNWHDWTMAYEKLESARLTLGNQIAEYCGAGTPLSVSVTAPANNAAVSGGTTLTATASGGVGSVASVQFVLDLGYSDQQNIGGYYQTSLYNHFQLCNTFSGLV